MHLTAKACPRCIVFPRADFGTLPGTVESIKAVATLGRGIDEARAQLPHPPVVNDKTTAPPILSAYDHPPRSGLVRSRHLEAGAGDAARDQVQHIAIMTMIGGVIGLGVGFAVGKGRA